MNLFQVFKDKGIDTISRSYYAKIEEWREWYLNYVPKFHEYKVYHGSGGSVKCRRLTLGMAKKVCEDIADLLLNEHVKITVDNDATNEFVASVLDANQFFALCNEYQERKASTGTTAYIPFIRDMVVDEQGIPVKGTATIGIEYVEGENIFPTSWENGRITECVFVFPKVSQQKSYVHLQYHHLEGDEYVIENYVYLDTSKTGTGRELTPEQWSAVPAFEGLVPKVYTASDKPQFTIDKLNIVNNADRDPDNPMGIAIYANALAILRKLDLEYDSYGNEFTLGRKRIFVAPEMLNTIDGDPVFDPNDSVFYQLPEGFFKDTKEAMHEVNMELRIEQHSKAINDDLNFLSAKCGFGTDHYKFEKGSIQTATQVISENSDMYRTLRKHENSLEKTLKELVRIIMHLGTVTGAEGIDENAEVTIEFDDSIIEDKTTERAEDRKDVSMGVMRLDEYRAKWYGETTEQAQASLPEQQGNEVMM